MNRFLIYILATVFCLLASASCIDRPSVVLSEDEMVDLLVDVHRSEGLLELQNSNAHADEEYQQAVMASVLVERGVTRAQYDSSLMWYAKHLKLFVRVYSHVEERLQEELELWKRKSDEAREFRISATGDSVEIWSIQDYLTLDSRKLSDARFWEIEPDSNYRAGDTLRWSFDVCNLAKGQKVFASMSYRAHERDFEYANQSYKNKMMSLPVGVNALLAEEVGHHEFTLYPDSSKAYGLVSLHVSLISPDSVQSPIFLRNISLKRYHPHE